jgi:predicted anti-sigma-YlaC factor YlaD
MNCDDIKQKLKPFLEDLLAEKEYKAFCRHLDDCGKCKVYVRSVGSLSNQLWKLGQLNVPEDLISTIQYKLIHPKEKDQPAKTKITKKQIVVGIALIILTIVLVLEISYFKKRRNSLNRDHTPIVRIEVIHIQEPPNTNETQSLLNKLEAIATKLGVLGKDNTTEGETGKENSGD